jgi:hypothetical protein
MSWYSASINDEGSYYVFLTTALWWSFRRKEMRKQETKKTSHVSSMRYQRRECGSISGREQQTPLKRFSSTTLHFDVRRPKITTRNTSFKQATLVQTSHPGDLVSLPPWLYYVWIIIRENFSIPLSTAWNLLGSVQDLATNAWQTSSYNSLNFYVGFYLSPGISEISEV